MVQTTHKEPIVFVCHPTYSHMALLNAWHEIIFGRKFVGYLNFRGSHNYNYSPQK